MLKIPALLLALTASVGAQQAPTLQAYLPGGAGMEFVWIDSGRFGLGTPDAQAKALHRLGWWEEAFANETPAREVGIDTGFYLVRYELTQAQWRGGMRGGMRGGSAHNARYLRSALRGSAEPNLHYNRFIGIRLLRRR